MAVQAQYPSNILPDYRNSRARQMFGGDNRVFLSSLTYNQNTLLNDFQIQPVAQNGTANSLRMFNQLAGPGQGSQHPSLNAAALFNESENEIAYNLLGSRKRPREGDDTLVTQWQRQQHHIPNVAEYNQQQTYGSGATMGVPQTTGVSTGLHLAFEDERINSTTSASTSERADASRSVLFAVGEDLNTQLQQQREEIEQFFKMQGEQARQLLEEKRQRHLQSLIAAIEEGVSRRLQEKDLEVEKMKRQNSELAEHVKQVSLEAHHWQSKARTYEAMATALRTNLQQAQQAVAFSREQSKEGCGDSEADDAASSHHGDMDDAHARTFKENRELREQRTCRVCRCNDVSILLLPCRHLCLCKECESRLDACPLCRSLKNASVQVYMS
ncbi:hypothetical protein CY35_18G097200 [Sphagnum magellanicum]|nr:hypothetical protein CY35_18G097200 [Sphagnum magellanicum]